MKKERQEVHRILETSDQELRNKIMNLIMETYVNSISEIENSVEIGLKVGEYPRIDYFLKSQFFHIFEKLHKGDKNISMIILDELRWKVIKL